MPTAIGTIATDKSKAANGATPIKTSAFNAVMQVIGVRVLHPFLLEMRLRRDIGTAVVELVVVLIYLWAKPKTLRHIVIPMDSLQLPPAIRMEPSIMGRRPSVRLWVVIGGSDRLVANVGK